jgi:hypothetical protein
LRFEKKKFLYQDGFQLLVFWYLSGGTPNNLLHYRGVLGLAEDHSFHLDSTKGLQDFSKLFSFLQPAWEVHFIDERNYSGALGPAFDDLGEEPGNYLLRDGPSLGDIENPSSNLRAENMFFIQRVIEDINPHDRNQQGSIRWQNRLPISRGF